MSKRKVTKEDAEMMKMLRSKGLTYVEIGKIFSVSPETAHRNIDPEYHEKRLLENRERRNHVGIRAKKVSEVKGIPESVKDLTLAEVIQKVENGAKKIEGNINNATLDDIAMLNEIFDVTFTVHMK